MAALRAVLAAEGFRDVRTLLNSGNAVFSATSASSRAHARRIEAAIATALGVDVPVVVTSDEEFMTVVRENPLSRVATAPSRLLVVFAGDATRLQGLEALATLVAPPERLVVGARAAYLWCPQGILASRAAGALLGTHAQGITSRNWATVLKIAACLGRGAA